MAYVKIAGKSSCNFKRLDDVADRALTTKEMATAQSAKTAALSILQDALDKKDRVLVHLSNKVLTEEYMYVMSRYAAVTAADVSSLILELKMLTFKAVTHPGAYAYVHPKDYRKTVYLCDQFWEAPAYLSKDCQPGILIHEASHFLGYIDLDYTEHLDPVLVSGLAVDPAKIEGDTSNSRVGELLALKKEHAEGPLAIEVLAGKYEQGQITQNANSLEYEFEITINHHGVFDGKSYQCCGETKFNSVCIVSFHDEYFLKRSAQVNAYLSNDNEVSTEFESVERDPNNWNLVAADVAHKEAKISSEYRRGHIKFEPPGLHTLLVRDSLDHGPDGTYYPLEGIVILFPIDQQH